MLSFEMRGLMDPYKLKPNFEYKKGILTNLNTLKLILYCVSRRFV